MQSGWVRTRRAHAAARRSERLREDAFRAQVRSQEAEMLERRVGEEEVCARMLSDKLQSLDSMIEEKSAQASQLEQEG